MSSFGWALPLLLLGAVAACTQPSEEPTDVGESNLDQADRDVLPAGPLAPDATFGSNGALTLTGPTVATSAAKRDDGSIVVLGGRDASASLTIIAADGSAQTDLVLVADRALAGEVHAHGDGVVVVGSAEGRYFVTRIGADGAVDTTFAPDPLDLVVRTSAVTSDGHIVIAGSFGDQAAMVRLDTHGRLDATFGDQGLMLADDLEELGELVPTAASALSVATKGDTCTAHLTIDAFATLPAAECATEPRPVALGNGKRALVTTTAAAVTVRVFGHAP